jgi:XTP/dITP diphosphohydrolase
MDDRIESRILLATSNEGKLDEFRRLVPSEIEVVSLSAFHVDLPPETGATFEENARIKAEAASAGTGLLALADDSGLEIDALYGAPGVFSARFSGELVNPARNRATVLDALKHVELSKRTARFRCAVALARDGRTVATSDGTIEGSIAFQERGIYGFGYDSIFLIEDGRTLAEVPPIEKNRISHRAQAFRAILPSLFEALAFPVPT